MQQCKAKEKTKILALVLLEFSNLRLHECVH